MVGTGKTLVYIYVDLSAMYTWIVVHIKDSPCIVCILMFLQ